jgi:broad specificity phosphatase PhoE
MAASDLGPPTTLYLVRHASTVDSQLGRVRGGAGAGPELSDAGRAQAAELVIRLKALLGAGVDPVALITSPARRARQTAEVLSEQLGLPPALVDNAWAEVNLGDWDGHTYAEISARWPELFTAWSTSSATAPTAGESLDEVAGRVAAAVRLLVGKHPGQTLVVVSHTAPIRTVIGQALEAGPAALWRLRLDPASVSVLRYWSDGGCEVAAVNVGLDSW